MMSRQAILAHMDVVLGSAEFTASPKIQALLRHIVIATLDNHADQLKGYTIGIDVFDRDPSFDPMLDSIVRVQMGRLRKMLAHHYATATTPQPIMIEIPKGQYGAVFTPLDKESPARVQSQPEPAAPPADPAQAEPEPEPEPLRRVLSRSAMAMILALGAVLLVSVIVAFVAHRRALKDPEPLPQIAIVPFRAPPGDALLSSYADNLNGTTASALSRQKLFPVVMLTQHEDSPLPAGAYSIGAGASPLLHIEGQVRRMGADIGVQVRLVKSAGEVLLWSAEWTEPANTAHGASAIATNIARELHLRIPLAVRDIMANNPRAANTPWLLYLNAAWVPGEAEDSLQWEKERVAYARRAIEIDPEFGPAHAVLADKLAYLANVDIDMEAAGARDEATQHARNALRLASDNPGAVANLANYYWHIGNMDMSEKMARRTGALDPDNGLAAFQALVHPYSCAAVPASVIAEAETFDAAMTSDNPSHWVTQTWLNQLYLNNADVARALAAGRKSFVTFRTPDTSLRLATTLVAAGKVAEARDIIQTIAPNWPHLSLYHYARSTMARRCGRQSEAGRMVKLYENMAQAMCAGTPKAPYCAQPGR